MKRINVVTKGEVERAIQDLESKGRNPSIAAIQRLVGGGNTTLMRLKQEIEDEKQALEDQEQAEKNEKIEGVICALGEGYQAAMSNVMGPAEINELRDMWLESVLQCQRDLDMKKELIIERDALLETVDSLEVGYQEAAAKINELQDAVDLKEDLLDAQDQRIKDLKERISDMDANCQDALEKTQNISKALEKTNISKWLSSQFAILQRENPADTNGVTSRH